MHTYSAMTHCISALASDADVGGLHGRVDGGPVLAASASLYGSAHEVVLHGGDSDADQVVKQGMNSGSAGLLWCVM